MKRRAFTILSILSLVLLLATAAAWVRAHWFYDRWVLKTGSNRCMNLTLNQDLAVIAWQRSLAASSLHDNFQWQFAGFSFTRASSMHPDKPLHLRNTSVTFEAWLEEVQSAKISPIYALSFPLWFPAVVFAPPPLWWLFALIRRRKKTQANLCPACAYDLRASQTHCPECGAPIPSITQSPAAHSPAPHSPA